MPAAPRPIKALRNRATPNDVRLARGKNNVRTDDETMAKPNVALEPILSATKEAGNWPIAYPQKKDERMRPAYE